MPFPKLFPIDAEGTAKWKRECHKITVTAIILRHSRHWQTRIGCLPKKGSSILMLFFRQAQFFF